MSDAQHYRTKDEVAVYQQQDPILIAKEKLVSKKWATEADFEAIDARVKALVQECVEFGEQSPFPEAHELWQDIYVQENYPFIKE
jgi:pyruvate dehydrogenase E1 component alpha subunit